MSPLIGAVVSLGAACAAVPARPPAPVRVVAVPMNVSGAVPPACRLPFGADGVPCADAGPAIPLTPAQAELVQGVLADPATWGGDEGKCTLPLHGFAWLAADGSVQSQVGVSLLCDKVEGAPAVAGQPQDPARRGVSAEGLLALRAACVAIGMPHCHITSPGEAFGG